MTASLLSRLQGLTGPDRYVDAEIALAIHPWLKDCPRNDRGDGPGWITKSGTRAYPARYTRSVDDAMTAIPDGRTWSLGKWLSNSGDGPPVYWAEFHGREEAQGRHAEPAIAIMIALFKVWDSEPDADPETDPHVLAELDRVHGLERGEDET